MNPAQIELELLYADAKKDPVLKERLLSTRSAADPYAEFCNISCEAGHPVTIGDLFAIGQEYSDNQCKSTNGGNPSPYESFEDTYEVFLDSLNYSNSDINCEYGIIKGNSKWMRSNDINGNTENHSG